MKRRCLAHAALAALVLAAFLPALSAGFLNWDDDRIITENPLFTAGGLTYARAAFTQVQFEAYQPLHLLSYLIDRTLWPESPFGFHLLNLVFYLGAVAITLVVTRRHAAAPAAFIAVLLLAVHPLCVEPVVWITSRKDCLSLLFFWAALCVEDGRDTDHARPTLFGLVMCVCALLTKTSTVCLPLVLFAWLVFLKRARLRIALLRCAPYAVFALLAAIPVPLFWRAHDMIPPFRPEPLVVDVAASYGVYLQHFLFPANLSPMYPAALPTPRLLAALFGACVLALIVLWKRLPNSGRFLAIAVFAALLPVANIVPLGFRYSDRYALLAVFVAAIPLARAFHVAIERLRSHRLRHAFAGALVIFFVLEAGLTFFQTRRWQTSETLWQHAVSVAPATYLVHFKYAETLRSEKKFRQATREYQAAVRLEPDRLLSYAGLFFAYASWAEHRGEIKKGVAQAWLDSLGRALADPATFQKLQTDVQASACGPCAASLLTMSLKRWPLADAELLQRAEAALAAGARNTALIHLGFVKNKNTRYQTLLKRVTTP